MKILVTGAHFTPAQAVIEELKKYSEVEIIYVGRKTTREGDPAASIESQVLPTLNVKFIPIVAGRVQRAFSVYTIPAILKIPFGFLQAFWIILKERPDATLSFGGYVAVPLVVASWLFSIPVIVHEQTLVSGLANKVSSHFADKIAISFSENNSFSGSKVVLTGNPIRQEIVENAQSSGRLGEPQILITGGNQGSHAINLAVEGCLEGLKKMAKIIHQTGDSKYRDFERLKLKEDDRYIVTKFIDIGWGKILAKSDLVISRAGMNTLTELVFLRKPALLIPFPYLYQDEQNKNAKYFEKSGMVKVLPQSRLSPHELLKNIKEMLKNLESFRKGAEKAADVMIPDAAKRVALLTYTLAKS